MAWKNFFPSSSDYDKSLIDNAIMHDNASKKGKTRERRNPTVRHAIASTTAYSNDSIQSYRYV